MDFDPKFSPQMWSSVQLMHLNYTLNYIFGAGTKWSKNLNGPKIFPQNVEQCAAHASKLHIQLDFWCRNTTKQKSIWILTHSVQLMHPKLHIQLDFWCRNITEQKSIWIFDFNTLFLWLIILVIFFYMVCKISNFKYVICSFLYWVDFTATSERFGSIFSKLHF